MNRRLQTAANLKNPKNGFTIVETLVAIAILMIAIAGPLVVANKSLTAALYAKDYAIGSFLAQEGVELLRNWKDNEGSLAFDLLTSGDCTVQRPSPSNQACKVGMDHPFNLTRFEKCHYCTLFTDPSSNSDYGYFYSNNSNPDQIQTIFSRWFYVDIKNQDEVKVTVVVSWNEGTVENEVKVNNEIVRESL